jgi:membrane-bound lytic murein transglycosylase D
MMRAVRKVGSEELSDLVHEYRSRSFGFASSNFFTELLAAIEVEKNSEKYFGKLKEQLHTFQ